MNPDRSIPIATIGGLLVMIVLYVVIQLAFILGVDWTALGVTVGNWAGLSQTVLANGPFYEIFRLSGVIILISFAVVLLIDAVVSPSGTSIITTGVASRTFYGLSADGHLPEFFLKLNRWRIPWISLIAAWLLGAIFILPFPTWQLLSTFIGSATVIAYLGGMPALIGLRRYAPEIKRKFNLPFARVITPIAFSVSVLLIYWTPYSILYGTIIITLSGMPIFFIYSSRRYNNKPKIAGLYSIIFVILIAYLTYAFAYKDLILGAQNGIVSQNQIIKDFVLFFISLTIVVFVYIVANYYNVDAKGRKHIKAGIWLVILLLVIMLLSFLGPYGIISVPFIPFPYDNLVAAIIGLAFYYWSVKTNFLSEDLEALLKSLKGGDNENKAK